MVPSDAPSNFPARRRQRGGVTGLARVGGGKHGDSLVMVVRAGGPSRRLIRPGDGGGGGSGRGFAPAVQARRLPWPSIAVSLPLLLAPP